MVRLPFSEMGDVFACHAISNPDMNSEVELLLQYAPSLPRELLESLSRVFTSLRVMVNDGQLAYPYSTRELVNIVRHLERFPEDSLQSVVENVFDFDSFDRDLRETILDIFSQHHIPMNNHQGSKKIILQPALAPTHSTDEWQEAGAVGYRYSSRHGTLTGHITLLTPTMVVELSDSADQVSSWEVTPQVGRPRSYGFSEKLFQWRNVRGTSISSVALKGTCFELRHSPLALICHRLEDSGPIERHIDLGQIFHQQSLSGDLTPPFPCMTAVEALDKVVIYEPRTAIMVEVTSECHITAWELPLDPDRKECGQSVPVQAKPCAGGGQLGKNGQAAFFLEGYSNFAIVSFGQLSDRQVHMISLPDSVFLSKLTGIDGQCVWLQDVFGVLYELHLPPLSQCLDIEIRPLEYRTHLPDANVFHFDDLVAIEESENGHLGSHVYSSPRCYIGLCSIQSHPQRKDTDECAVHIINRKAGIDGERLPLKSRSFCFLPDQNLWISALSYDDVTLLELIDIRSRQIRLITVQRRSTMVTQSRMMIQDVPAICSVSRISENCIIVFQFDGHVTVFQVCGPSLQESLKEWISIRSGEAQREIESNSF